MDHGPQCGPSEVPSIEYGPAVAPGYSEPHTHASLQGPTRWIQTDPAPSLQTCLETSEPPRTPVTIGLAPIHKSFLSCPGNSSPKRLRWACFGSSTKVRHMLYFAYTHTHVHVYTCTQITRTT